MKTVPRWLPGMTQDGSVKGKIRGTCDDSPATGGNAPVYPPIRSVDDATKPAPPSSMT